MNAYELADELEGFGYLNSDDGLHFCPFQAQVDMLRQQQAEIDRNCKYIRQKKQALKHEIADLQLKIVMLEKTLGYSPLNDYAAVKQK